jgi:hypothetical protein
MNKAVAEIPAIIGRETLAEQITSIWSKHNQDRQPWLAQKLELRNYLFATDTTTTTNSKLPWKNKTTIPKLTQIRDNLQANYLSALFPTEHWLKWEGHGKDGVTKAKRVAVEAYMQNKVREGDYRSVIEKLINDYIDYGISIYDTEWVNESTTDPETGELIPGYIGPKLVRISPNDIVFNPLAATFDDSYKVTRSLKTLGELKEELDSRPEMGYNRTVIEKAEEVRSRLSTYSSDDMNKAVAYQVDGFGSLADYYQSNLVEILEFEGTLHSADGQFYKNYIITVIDRAYVARAVRIPSWTGKSSKGMVGWRERPDSLYAMGPLDNLVGMQYRIDHLENLKADAQDLAVHPPLAIMGNVEEFIYGPGEEIFVSEGGSVQELGKNLNGVISADNAIAILEQKMEEMAGAPKQAMGIRTPGEKTAFEVQTLEMAASRIFQNKITKFEIQLVEPSLNRMLELSRRNMDGTDVVRVMDDDVGVVDFLSVTKADIASAGKIRAIGARHFAAQAVLVQNLVQLMGSPLGQDPGVKVHFSGKAMAKLIEEMLGLERFSVYQENVRIAEQHEQAQLADQAVEDIGVAGATPTEAPDVPEA